MARRPHRPKAAYADDPLVSVHPDRVQAAIEAAGQSRAAVAKALGTRPQSIDYLATGAPGTLKRCRKSRRKALAELLHADGEWLEGVRPLAVQELGRMPQDLAHRLPPKSQLALGALYREVAKALKREFDQPEVRDEARRIGVDYEIVEFHLFADLLRLASPLHWQEQLTTVGEVLQRGEISRPQATGALHDFPEHYTPEEAIASFGLITTLRLALRPWIEGKVALDYNRLRELVGYTRRDDSADSSRPLYPRYLGQICPPFSLMPMFALGGSNA